MPHSPRSHLPSFAFRPLAAFVLMSIAACAAPSTRIASELGRYGLDATQAQCVGERLQANLSLGQLQQLARAAGAFGMAIPRPAGSPALTFCAWRPR
jgi:hypothetical protein